MTQATEGGEETYGYLSFCPTLAVSLKNRLHRSTTAKTAASTRGGAPSTARVSLVGLPLYPAPSLV